MKAGKNRFTLVYCGLKIATIDLSFSMTTTPLVANQRVLPVYLGRQQRLMNLKRIQNLLVQDDCPQSEKVEVQSVGTQRRKAGTRNPFHGKVGFMANQGIELVFAGFVTPKEGGRRCKIGKAREYTQRRVWFQRL